MTQGRLSKGRLPSCNPSCSLLIEIHGPIRFEVHCGQSLSGPNHDMKGASIRTGSGGKGVWGSLLIGGSGTGDRRQGKKHAPGNVTHAQTRAGPECVPKWTPVGLQGVCPRKGIRPGLTEMDNAHQETRRTCKRTPGNAPRVQTCTRKHTTRANVHQGSNMGTSVSMRSWIS